MLFTIDGVDHVSLVGPRTRSDGGPAHGECGGDTAEIRTPVGKVQRRRRTYAFFGRAGTAPPCRCRRVREPECCLCKGNTRYMRKRPVKKTTGETKGARLSPCQGPAGMYTVYVCVCGQGPASAHTENTGGQCACVHYKLRPLCEGSVSSHGGWGWGGCVHLLLWTGRAYAVKCGKRVRVVPAVLICIGAGSNAPPGPARNTETLREERKIGKKENTFNPFYLNLYKEKWSSAAS